jgi:hypothetical protein
VVNLVPLLKSPQRFMAPEREEECHIAFATSSSSTAPPPLV